MNWAQRLWLALLCAVACGGTSLIWGGYDARAHIGLVILVSLLAGAVLVAVAERVPTVSQPARRRPVRTLLLMLAVLVPPAIAASILLGTATPLIIVVIFGGMALPIVWQRR